MSPVKWYLAKYVPDLRRNEPINIGVIATFKGEVFHKFFDVQGDPVVDQIIRSPLVFREWLSRWRRILDSEGFVDALLERRAGDNYYIETAGEILVGEPPTTLKELGDELYNTLVM